MRLIPTVRQSRCGACKKPILVLESLRYTTAVDQLEDGSEIPHQCPEKVRLKWKEIAEVLQLAKLRRGEHSKSGREERP